MDKFIPFADFRQSEILIFLGILEHGGEAGEGACLHSGVDGDDLGGQGIEEGLTDGLEAVGTHIFAHRAAADDLCFGEFDLYA